MDMKNILSPWFISGFTDAEGSFMVSIVKNSKRSMGFVLTYSFIIGLNFRDKHILESIKASWGVGEIYNHPSDNTQRYKVSNKKDILNVVIPHFNKYPLVTQKYIDFWIFKNIMYMIEKKEHLTQEGLNKIVNLRANLNLGILDIDKLKDKFLLDKPIRLKHTIESIPNS